LIDLHDYIAFRDGPERAIGYIDRIEECCQSLAMFSDRGIRRDDLRSGLRILGFERRAVIAFQIGAETVTILRILYGGRDLEAAFPLA
jgi:toxin ParE1/3/4